MKVLLKKMISSTTNDKVSQQDSNSNKNAKRNALPQDTFNQVHYNKMVDDSKHTDIGDPDHDADLSRYEYSDT